MTSAGRDWLLLPATWVRIPYAPNANGSTAKQLARWATGRGGSGSAEAMKQQQESSDCWKPSMAGEFAWQRQQL
jgi:hypothetical protein